MRPCRGTLHNWGVGVQVVVPYYHGAGVALVQLFEQLAHGLLLSRCPCVGGLTADVQTTLVTNTYRVLVVVLACYMAVGANEPFRSSQLYCSVTTYDVVVADAELEAPLFSSDFALTYFWKILPFFSAEPTTMRSVSGWNRTRREVICLGL